VIDTAAIKARFEALEPVLDERERRLFAASEARAAGHGGVVAVSRATGIARSTIDRGLADLRSGAVIFSPRGDSARSHAMLGGCGHRGAANAGTQLGRSFLGLLYASHRYS